MSAISCTINLSVCGNSVTIVLSTVNVNLCCKCLQSTTNMPSVGAPETDFCHIHLGSPDTLIGSLILRLDIQTHGTVLVPFHQPTFFGEKEPPQSEA